MTEYIKNAQEAKALAVKRREEAVKKIVTELLNFIDAKAGGLGDLSMTYMLDSGGSSFYVAAIAHELRSRGFRVRAEGYRIPKFKDYATSCRYSDKDILLAISWRKAHDKD